MSLLANFFGRVKLAPTDAEVIFDRDEPIGRTTDLVMPRRRWLRWSKETNNQQRTVIPIGSRPGANSQ
jgi:hypothetical protein